jgi:hypothetical protein
MGGTGFEERLWTARRGGASSVTIGVTGSTGAHDRLFGRRRIPLPRMAMVGVRKRRGQRVRLAHPAPDFTRPSAEKCRAETSVVILSDRSDDAFESLMP